MMNGVLKQTREKTTPLFPGHIYSYPLKETLPNSLHHTSAVPQPFLLLIAANLDLAGFLDWNGAYGLIRLGWRFHNAKLSFYSPYIKVSMIWNTYEISALHLSPATAIFVVDCCQFGPSWILGLKMKLMTCSGLVDGTTEQSCIFPDLNIAIA